MDELEISGKRYISTRRAAKEHKYHSDYIGQLIRAGKVEGQKVGRSWYVIADSLAEYLGKESGAMQSLDTILESTGAVIFNEGDPRRTTMTVEDGTELIARLNQLINQEGEKYGWLR